MWILLSASCEVSIPGGPRGVFGWQPTTILVLLAFSMAYFVFPSLPAIRPIAVDLLSNYKRHSCRQNEFTSAKMIAVESPRVVFF
jgi:hypothetical protein